MSQEFANDKLLSRTHNIRWIHVGTDFDGRTPEDDAYTHVDPSEKGGLHAHGTAMLSLVAGNTLGIAKRANVVIVRMPRRSRTGGNHSPEDFLDGLQAISDDIADHPSGDGVSAMVLIAQGYPREVFGRKNRHGATEVVGGVWIYDDFGWMTRCKTLLSSLATYSKALVIPAAGNINALVPIWPAAFARKTETNPLEDMLVVGGVSNDGTKVTYPINVEAYGIPHVLAPGDEVRVAEGHPTLIEKREAYRLSKGTSDGK